MGKTILEEALEITSKDRQSAYGEPEDNFAQIAEYWTVYFRKELKRQLNDSISFDNRFAEVKELIEDIIDDFHYYRSDVGIMMVLMKLAREQNIHHRDNLIDMAGYIRCVSMIEGDEKEE